MAPLNSHAQQLYVDLGYLAESGASEVGKQVVAVYNKLLERAKELMPDDEVLSTLDSVGPSLSPRVLQSLTAQLRLTLGNA